MEASVVATVAPLSPIEKQAVRPTPLPLGLLIATDGTNRGSRRATSRADALRATNTGECSHFSGSIFSQERKTQRLGSSSTRWPRDHSHSQIRQPVFPSRHLRVGSCLRPLKKTCFLLDSSSSPLIYYRSIWHTRDNIFFFISRNGFVCVVCVCRQRLFI